MSQEIPEENENLENEGQTGEPTQAKRKRGWQKGKPRKTVPDVALASSVDGRQDEGIIYDTEAGEARTARGRGIKFPPNLLQIGLIALIVSLLVVVVMTSWLTPMVGKNAYKADITRLETDLVNIRGSNYVAGTSLMGLKSQYDTLNSRSNAFLVQGDLEGYATTSELNSVRNAIPSASSITSTVTDSVNGEIDTKLAQIDAALATLGNSSNYVTQAQLAQTVAYLQSLMVTGGTLVSYNAVGAGTTYAFLVGPASAGNYTGVEMNFTYPVSSTTLLSSVGATQFVISASTPPAGETITYTTSLSGGLTYITGVKIVLAGAGITTPGGVYWSVGAANLDKLGTPATVVVKAKT